jgi:predicted SAM-dependent methyltransferase
LGESLKMKLHLGCGQVYLEGYVNIDFPLSEHTVQQKSIADELHDLTKLRYKSKSIDEVRLHHTFEHFPRHIAVALLAGWHTWLKRGGLVHIEVPDFEESAKLALNNKTSIHDRKVAMRHIFGSNEAPWATHYEGWTEASFRELLKLFGFKIISLEKSAYMATRNITVIAKKTSLTELSQSKARKRASDFLQGYTVDNSDFEASLLNIWLGEFDNQFKVNRAQ